MDPDLLARWLDHLQFTAADRDVVAAASRWVTGAPLRAARTPSEIAPGRPRRAGRGGRTRRRRQCAPLARRAAPRAPGDQRRRPARRGRAEGPEVGSGCGGARRTPRRARGRAATPSSRSRSPTTTRFRTDGPLNDLRWDGEPGHYEVWFLTLTDRGSGLGIWIRFAMHAPLDGPADCSLWFAAMHRDGTRFGGREVFPADQLHGDRDPVPARHRRRRAVRPRHGGRLRRRALGAALDARRRARAAGAPAGRAGEAREDDVRHPAAADRGRRHRHVRRADASSCPARTAGRPTCGAPATRTAGAGRTPPTCRRSAGDAAPTATGSTASRSPRRGWAARSGRRRRSSAGCSASRSARRARAGPALEGQQPADELPRQPRTSAPAGSSSRCDAVARGADRRGLRRPRRRPAALLEQRGRRPALPRLGPHAARRSAAGTCARRCVAPGARVLRVRPARPDRRRCRSHIGE